MRAKLNRCPGCGGSVDRLGRCNACVPVTGDTNGFDPYLPPRDITYAPGGMSEGEYQVALSLPGILAATFSLFSRSFVHVAIVIFIPWLLTILMTDLPALLIESYEFRDFLELAG